MSKFYGNWAYISCAISGCNAQIQFLSYDEQGNPIDTNWDELGRVYDAHNATCSEANPYTQDPNSYYGDPDACYESPCEY